MTRDTDGAVELLTWVVAEITDPSVSMVVDTSGRLMGSSLERPVFLARLIARRPNKPL